MAVRVAILASGDGSNAQAVLDAAAAGRIAADVVAVVSDHADANVLDRARRAGVAAHALERRQAESRAEYDRRLVHLLSDIDPDWVVLAGWMRILTMTVLGRFPNRVVNLHPARPGELAGTHAVERAWHEFVGGRRTSTGVMVHLVPDEDVDSGPVLATVDVPIHADDSLESLTARVHAAEHDLLVAALAGLVDPAPDRLQETTA